MKSITEKIRSKYDLMDDHGARVESLEFYQRIIEDIINRPVVAMRYEKNVEHIIADIGWDELVINVAMSSLSACTRDVIRQATNWRDNQ